MNRTEHMPGERSESLIAPPSEAQTLPRSIRKRLIELVGVFYLLAIVVAVGSLVLFVWLADEVLEQEFSPLNRAILLFINSFASPFWERLAFALSWLGSVYGITAITILFGGWLLLRRRFVDVSTLLVTVLGSTVLTLVLKAMFQQIRPQVFTPLAIERNFSFPSGHSLGSLCLFGFIGAWLVLQNSRQIWRWWVAGTGVAIAVMIGLSRLYLGVHWPTDVLAGFLVASFWVSACVAGQRLLLAYRERRKSRRRVVRTMHHREIEQDGGVPAGESGASEP